LGASRHQGVGQAFRVGSKLSKGKTTGNKGVGMNQQSDKTGSKSRKGESRKCSSRASLTVHGDMKKAEILVESCWKGIGIWDSDVLAPKAEISMKRRGPQASKKRRGTAEHMDCSIETVTAEPGARERNLNAGWVLVPIRKENMLLNYKNKETELSNGAFRNGRYGGRSDVGRQPMANVACRKDLMPRRRGDDRHL